MARYNDFLSKHKAEYNQLRTTLGNIRKANKRRLASGEWTSEQLPLVPSMTELRKQVKGQASFQKTLAQYRNLTPSQSPELYQRTASGVSRARQKQNSLAKRKQTLAKNRERKRQLNEQRFIDMQKPRTQTEAEARSRLTPDYDEQQVESAKAMMYATGNHAPFADEDEGEPDVQNFIEVLSGENKDVVYLIDPNTGEIYGEKREVEKGWEIIDPETQDILATHSAYDVSKESLDNYVTNYLETWNEYSLSPEAMVVDRIVSRFQRHAPAALEAIFETGAEELSPDFIYESGVAGGVHRMLDYVNRHQKIVDFWKQREQEVFGAIDAHMM